MGEFYWPIAARPGIQRDSTKLDNDCFLDGEWVRFYNNKPKKMGGRKLIQAGNDKIIRNCYAVTRQGAIDLYQGRSDSLLVTRIDPNGNSSISRDRTPAGFVANDNYTWQFAEVLYGGIDHILAMPVPNLNDISNITPGTLYSGEVGNDAPLTVVNDDSSTPITASGGVVVIGNVIMIYGANGEIRWNNGDSISGTGHSWIIENTVVMGAENFVYAAPVRNGDVPGGLFWAIQGLVKATSTGVTTIDTHPQPQFDIAYVSYTSSLLSSNCVVNYDPYFYWIGKDTFYMYNGVVAEIDNQVNKLYFFQNLNFASRQKVFGFANTQYQEVWWGWALGEATENTNALILNKNYSTWFDTASFYRASGVNGSSLLPYPVLCSSILQTVDNINFTYPIWMHEIGLDEVVGAQQFAINSFIQSRYIDNQNNNAFVVDDILLDLIQSGNMTVQVTKQGYPRTTPVLSNLVEFTPTTEHLTMREKGNLLSFIFTSNTGGGDYFFGNTIVKITGDEDERPGPVNE